MELLRKHIDEHEKSKVDIQEKIDEVCRALREAVDEMEERLGSTIEEWYKKEEARLQESLVKLYTLGEEGTDEEAAERALKEAEAALCCVQRYELKMPQCKDVKEWACNALCAEFRTEVRQSLSEEFLKKRKPRITEVREATPNDVHIGISFLEPEEEAAMKKMALWSGVEYVVEMWNGEEGEDLEVRSEQVLGPSHNACVEWRFPGGSECLVRGKATWRDPSCGEQRASEWSEWVPFTIPVGHKSSGVYKNGVAWERWEAGETYVVTNAESGDVLYRGPNTYTRLPPSLQGRDVVVKGSKDGREWKKTIVIERIAKTPENLLNDLRIFHTDADVCERALGEITTMARCK